MNYANIIKSSNPSVFSGGYKNVFFFCPLSEFLILAKPTAAGLVLGDTLAIPTAHTFTSPKGFHSWECKQHSISIKGATIGDEGSAEMEWSAEFTLIGDGASTVEQLQRLLNDDTIVLLKEADCLVNDSYTQLGDECIHPQAKVEYDSKTTKEGKKEYKVTLTCKRRYFYAAVVTMSVT